MNRGKFITFEGNDGSGKTTISKLVYEQLSTQGINVIFTREPGGIEIAEQIRQIILDPNNKTMDARTEALLYAASRRQHLVEKILPALNNGIHVICDRFIDSSLAYQGMGRQIGMQEVYDMNLFATEGILPDLTLFLDVSVEEAMNRMASREAKDRLEQEDNAFHQRVRLGYEKVKELYPQRIHVIDAHQSIEKVTENCMQEIERIFDQDA
ncbi:dTMP kinase [Merdibacter massiliensis]|uniref:dTMP kinase n=1 Tax=Merdibacter massiliensis TaxID=1871030 RepID=UPI00096AC4E8|nr:dTMP kinase [Merdibacter massiliensis]